MGSRKIAKWVLLGIFVGLLIGTAVLGALNPGSGKILLNKQDNSLESLGSTNPSSPTLLSDDSELSDYYYSSSYYYYRTSSTASSSYYHVIWLKPSNYDFDLALYSDSGYSNCLAGSYRGGTSLDWVIVHPSASQYYYAEAWSCSSEGSCYIEYEDSSSSLAVGSAYSCYLSSYDCIETYMIYLNSGTTYSFDLDLTSWMDYDLYLYYLTAGSAASYSGYVSYSCNWGEDIDEHISYTPSYTGYYAVVVARQSGSGTAYLYTSIYSGSYTSLSDEAASYQSYSSYTNYYYQTGYAYSGYYHVVWLQPTSSSYTDNLLLYSDSSFRNQLASSTRGSGYLNWVVVRPSSSQNYYPRVYSYSAGYAYIEWECSYSYLDVGESVYGSLNSAECVEIYTAVLSSSKTYTFILDMPSSGDYDLYLYRLYYGEATDSSGYYRCSVSYGSGNDEAISNFKPYTSDEYLIMVVRSSGSGSFTLTLKEPFIMSPGAIMLVVFGIMATIGISAGVYKKYSRPRPGQPQRTAPTTPQAVKPSPQKLDAVKPIQKVPQYITCAYCQFKNDINGIFCSHCGSEL